MQDCIKFLLSDPQPGHSPDFNMVLLTICAGLDWLEGIIMIEVIEWAFSSGYAPETDPPDTPPPP